MPVTAENSLQMPIFQFNNLSRFPEIRHGISTRFAPQKPLYPEAQPPNPDDYKMGGANTGLPDETIRLRRGEFLAAVGGNPDEHLDSLTSGYQKHSAHVAVVGPEMRGANRNWRHSIPDTDALVTDQPGIPLLTGHADCPPILLYDPVKRVIAAAHSGWRGTVAKIAAETIKVMQHGFGSNPADIIAGIGPSIGDCCYTVGDLVVQEVIAAFGEEAALNFLPLQSDGSRVFDLWAAIEYTLVETGVPPENIEHSELCTLCHHDTFFSYRATPPDMKGKQGNYGALIMLME